MICFGVGLFEFILFGTLCAFCKASQVAQWVKNPPAMQEMLLDPWVRKIPGEGHGNSLQYSCLENPMDREAGWPIVHRVSKSQTQMKWLSMSTPASSTWISISFFGFGKFSAIISSDTFLIPFVFLFRLEPLSHIGWHTLYFPIDLICYFIFLSFCLLLIGWFPSFHVPNDYSFFCII